MLKINSDVEHIVSSDFGEEVLINNEPRMAIFQNGSREINEEGYVVNSNNPFLIIPGDEAIPTETTIKARGKDWVVRDCQLKPYGTMEVYLSETRNQE